MITLLEYLYVFIFGSQILLLGIVGFGLKRVIKSVNSPVTKEGVSVIIAAKDEFENVSNYLNSWLEQEHSNFEVIVVNDRSTDGTEEYLNGLSNPLLRVFHLKENESKGKKDALKMGIKEAKFERLFFTDADCFPSTPLTLLKMTSGFSHSKEIVLGGVPVVSGKGFVQNLIGFDNLYTNFQYLGLASIGNPYMGVGRNLLYSKKIFKSVNGFDNNKDLKFGDDDLFVNQAASKKNTAIVLDSDAVVFSNGPSSFNSWIGQKTRHVKASPRYKIKDKLILGLWNGGQMLIPILFILLFIFPTLCTLVISLWFLRLVIQYITLKNLFILYNQNKLVRFLPILDIVYSVFLFYLGIKTLTKKSIKWK